jgi:hypothetical protein
MQMNARQFLPVALIGVGSDDLFKQLDLFAPPENFRNKFKIYFQTDNFDLEFFSFK